MKKYAWLILFLLPLIFFFPRKEKDAIIVEPIEEVEKEGETIKIDIKGAVTNPGIYVLKEGSRVSDAIELAGGLMENADTSRINLSKILQDEMVIIIYTKEEIQSLEAGNLAIKYVEKECICPSIQNDGCINQESIENNIGTTNGKVSLNSGTLKDFMSLSGIGEAKANAIIEYRNQNGPFKEIHDITKVSGIGESIYAKIKDHLTL